jgi:hypothetical protein
MKDIAIVSFFLAPYFLSCDCLLLGILTYIVCGITGIIALLRSYDNTDFSGGPWWWGGL